jgi:hypothetical protein
MSRTIKAHKEAATHEAITRRESQMTYDNEAIVRNAYHTAEGNVLDIPGWIGSFTEDGVFNNVSGEAAISAGEMERAIALFADDGAIEFPHFGSVNLPIRYEGPEALRRFLPPSWMALTTLSLR